MCFYYVAFPLSAYGLSYWLPTIVQDFGVSNTANGFINTYVSPQLESFARNRCCGACRRNS